jgi:hypothetical protein
MIELEVLSAGPSPQGEGTLVRLGERAGHRTLELELSVTPLREILCRPENRAGRRTPWVSIVAELARLGRVVVKAVVLDAGAGGLVAHVELRRRLAAARVPCPIQDALCLAAGLAVPLYATEGAFASQAPGRPAWERRSRA